jgi:hypothetical protein
MRSPASPAYSTRSRRYLMSRLSCQALWARPEPTAGSSTDEEPCESRIDMV